MKLPEASHPIWLIIRQGMLFTVLSILLTVNYERFDARDWTTIVYAMLGMGGFDVLKKMVTKEPNNEH